MKVVHIHGDEEKGNRYGVKVLSSILERIFFHWFDTVFAVAVANGLRMLVLRLGIAGHRNDVFNDGVFSWLKGEWYKIFIE